MARKGTLPCRPSMTSTSQTSETGVLALSKTSSMPQSVSLSRTSSRTSRSSSSRSTRSLSKKCLFGLPTCPGCSPVQRNLDQEQIDEHRRYFFETLTGVYAKEILELKSASAHKTQLVSHYFKHRQFRTLPRHREIIETLEQWFEPQNDAAAAATDCLLLYQYGVDNGDRRCEIRSRKRHQAALQHLQVALTTAKPADYDGLLNAVDALALCEMCVEPSDNANAWRQHARGLCSVLRARGPANITSDYTRHLIMNAVHLSLMDALSTRKAFLFGEPDWLEEIESWKGVGRIFRMQVIACRLPALLERLDKLDFETGVLKDIASLLEDFYSVHRRFQRWLQACHDELPDDAPESVDVATYPDFLNKYGDVSDAYPLVYRFRNLQSALRHSTYFSMMLIVCDAIEELQSRASARLRVSDAKRKPITRQEVRWAVDSVCMCVPYLLRGQDSDTMNATKSIAGSLLWVMKWMVSHYDETRQEPLKLAYCRTILKSLETAPQRFAAGGNRLDWNDNSAPLDGAGFLVRRILWQLWI